jgi:hypothetical protein
MFPEFSLEGDRPSHVVPTATLFGLNPRRMKTPAMVKKD